MKFSSTERDVWFTSDTHYSHRNLTKGGTLWDNDDKCRDFSDELEMNELIVKNINDNVKPQDVLFHDGDWSFGGVDRIEEFRSRIRCNTVHLIRGNHDKHLRKLGENIQGFASINDYLRIQIDDQAIILSHYPMKSWHHSYYGAWMLFGHCHGNLRNQIPTWMLKRLLDEERWDDLKALSNDEEVEGIYPHGYSLDIGIDTHPEFRPYSFAEIKAHMNKVKDGGWETHSDRL